jgi:hypothetical protein
MLVIALELRALGPGIPPRLPERRALVPVLAFVLPLTGIVLLCCGTVLPAGGRGVALWVRGTTAASVLREIFACPLVPLEWARILCGPIVGVAGSGPVKATPSGVWCAVVVLCKGATGGIAWWALILVAFPVSCPLVFPARGCRPVPALAVRRTVARGAVSRFLGVAWWFLGKMPFAWWSVALK